MTRRMTFGLLGLILTIAFVSPAVLADDSRGPKPIPVGPEHALLTDQIGTWSVAGKTWHGPGEPGKTQGVQVIRGVIGGRGIAYDYTAKGEGFTMTGTGITSYNHYKRRYEAYWFDSFSWTGGSLSYGTYDAKTKTMTELLRGLDEHGKPFDMKVVNVFTDKDHHTLTFFMLGPVVAGKARTERRFMELVYTRKK